MSPIASSKIASPAKSPASSVDPQALPTKAGNELSASKDVSQKKAVTSDSSMQAANDAQAAPKFEHALSHAKAAQKADAKASAAKSKTASSDDEDSSRTDKTDQANQTNTPDITLLMSLLPALPQNVAAPGTGEPNAALPPATDAIAATASTIVSNAAGSAAPISDASGKPALPPLLTTEAQKAAAPEAGATAAAFTLPDGLSASAGKSSEKIDLLASIAANVDAATSTATPQLATSSHQASTLTAAALALPVTAPGALDEMAAANGEWPTALGHRVMWAVGEGLQKVEISVTPQDMGPIKVNIHVDNDKADIRFTAAHATTRDALEASIPRLRDMFSQQGLNLSQAQVFSQNSQDSGGRQPDAQQNQTGSQSGSKTETQEPERAKPMSWRSGLVDDYA